MIKKSCGIQSILLEKLIKSCGVQSEQLRFFSGHQNLLVFN
jgi:hypothetical protein